MLLQVQMEFFAAKICQLPPIVAVKDSCEVPVETFQLATTETVVAWLVCWPLQRLDSVPNLVRNLRIFRLVFASAQPLPVLHRVIETESGCGQWNRYKMSRNLG